MNEGLTCPTSEIDPATVSSAGARIGLAATSLVFAAVMVIAFIAPI